MTEGQDGSGGEQEGYGGGVGDREGAGGDVSAKEERKIGGYGGDRDMDREIGA